MLGIFMNAVTSKGLTPGAQTAETGAVTGQEGLASFGALMAQILAGEGAVDTGAKGKLTQLATVLGKFRDMAQESLAEVFPDGMITPGPEFDAWAKTMLTQLDGMLQGIGAGLGDLAQMLAPVEGLEFEAAVQAGGLLTQAAQVLTGGSGGILPADAGEMAEMLPQTLTVRDADTSGLEQAVKTAIEAVSKGSTSLTEVDITAMVEGMPETATLPEPLKVLLAQVMAAPADKALPPEVQAILSAQPQAASPVAAVTPVAAPAPQQGSNPAQPNGFARNLAGQIRGVSFTEGTTRIELTPQGLGKMEIEIAPDEAGKLRVVVRAENPAVLNALRQDRDMLAGLIRDGGASVDDSAMSFEEFGQRQQAAFGQETGGTVATSALTDDEEEALASTPVTSDGRLDILT